MSFINDLSQIYTSILTEDYASSVAQSLNILKNNQVHSAEDVNRILEYVYNNVDIEDEEHRNSKRDSDIVALAYMYLSGKTIDEISDIYRQYVNSKESYSAGLLSSYVSELTNKIKAQKLFKPSEEKTRLIDLDTRQLITQIHANYTYKGKREEADIDKIDSDDKVYEDNNIAVFVADSKQKCILYGDQNLCISQRPGEGLNYYWKYRLGRMEDDDMGMTTYFVFWKDRSNKILIDALGNEDGPANAYSWNSIQVNRDERITENELIQNFPVLKPAFDNDVFKFIPYGENEERFFYIDTKIKSILDPELKTYEDFQMFIESDKLVTEEEWNKLNPSFAKSLFKKYIGTGRLGIPWKLFDKFITKGTDIKWYEEVVSRNEASAVHYYLYKNGSLDINENFNPSVLNVVKSHIVKIKDFRDDIIKNYSYDGVIETSIIIPNYFAVLPDFKDFKLYGSFTCKSNHVLISLVGAPSSVTGHFDCNTCMNLTSLEGAPSSVGVNFNCKYNNNLTSLEGAPSSVGGDFFCSAAINLTSLKGAPSSVGGDFFCKYNNLTSLVGAPSRVGGHFDCSNNNLTSLEGAPSSVGRSFFCKYNNLTSLEGAPSNVVFCNPQNNGKVFSQEEIRAAMSGKDSINEFSTFESLLDALLILNEEINVSKIENVSISKISRDMENLEKRYFPSHLSQDFDDIEDDTNQRGFTGYGIFDDASIKGYIYGYAISGDEYSDLEYIDFQNVDFYNQALKNKLLSNENYMETFKKIFTPSNTLYVSNLIVDTPYRRHTFKLISDFIKDLKSNGYKYIAFDALSDTVNLFMDKAGNVKTDRLAKAGLSPLLTLDTSYSKLSLFSI
jgi:hypothetical protein